jgi:hypothetical protein
MRLFRLPYFGFKGNDSARSGAKRDAKRRLDAALAGSYDPWLFRDRGYLLLVWRQPEGWTYRIIKPNSNAACFVKPSCAPRPDFTAAVRKAAYHFAQEVYADFNRVPQQIRSKMSPKDLNELLWWFATFRQPFDGRASAPSVDSNREVGSPPPCP